MLVPDRRPDTIATEDVHLAPDSAGPTLLIRFKKHLRPEMIANLRESFRLAESPGTFAAILPHADEATVYQRVDGRWVPLDRDAQGDA